ncbi:ABC transporter ATP-binding protein [Paraclostridium sp. AKS46]|nr:ABC transporter ATP-binding protein [Paraclostridium sp. AKS46]
METLLEFDNVCKCIGKQEILRDINLKLNKGEIIGIIGSNGSGKTTILRLASGLIYASRGKIKVNNEILEPGFFGNLAKDIGILIESPKFIENLTGFENLNYLSKIKNIIGKKEIEDALIMVGLNPLDKKKVNSYSLGMRQRLGIAQAIMENPNIILFDEPTNGLDSKGVDLFEKIINSYKDKGTGFLIVSHNMDEIKRFCDRVFKIEDKTIVEQERTYNCSVMLYNLTDLELVLKSRVGSSIGDRVENNPVVIISYKQSENIVDFLNKLNIEYKVLRDTSIDA